MKAPAAAVLALAAMLLTGGCSTSQPEPQGSVVQVAAAADLQFALPEILELVAATHPEITVEVTYGSSGQFVQQIANGAPFDMYLSADLSYPRELVELGLAQQDDVFAYAVGRLVLWAPEGSPVDVSAGLSVLTDDAIRTVAVANPEHAPYGRAALAALESAGVAELVQPKLVLGENVAQAAEFVRSGNAQVGIVAMSLVLADPLRDQGQWVEVPLESFPRLEQGGVVLASAQDPDAARALRGVLLSDPGRDVLARYGFILDQGQDDEE